MTTLGIIFVIIGIIMILFDIILILILLKGTKLNENCFEKIFLQKKMNGIKNKNDETNI